MITKGTVKSYLDQWLRAVELQRSRLVDEVDSDWSIEGAFFTFALRNLLRAADMACEITFSTEVIAALTEFEMRVPAAKDLRDVLEHFDAYWEGIGNLQHPGKHPRDRRPEDASDPWEGQRRRHAPAGSFGFHGWRTNGGIVIAAGELSIDVVVASNCAQELVARIRTVLDSGDDTPPDPRKL